MLFGYTTEQIVGKPLAWFLDTDQGDEVLKGLGDIHATANGSFTATARVRTVTGAWRQVQMQGRRICADNSVGSVTITFQDVAPATVIDARAPDPSAISRMGAAFEKLSRAIEQTADSVVITDRDGVIEYVNPAFETMTGYSTEEAIGRRPRILHSGIHPNEFYARLWSTILSGGTFRAIMTNRRRDGTLYDEDQTITPIKDSAGRITHFVSTGRDITQRTRTQEALRRLNQQLECEAARIGGLLHDEAGQFLTTAHITLAEVCAAVAPDVREKLIVVRGHLDQIEKRLREISHEIHPQVVQDLGLRDAVALLVDAFSRRTGTPVTLESRIQTRYPLPVETLLYRLVQEGLTNINRHARATRGRISLDGDARAICCSIKDDGVGFDVVALASRPAGLGLRLIQDRLEAVGGTLAIVSACGSGTELLATVPVQS